MKKALLASALGLWLAPAAHAAVPTRLLYASDWNGPTQIFAANPATGETVGQLTFGHVYPCGTVPIGCGYGYPLPSRDGTKLTYLEVRDARQPSVRWVADADGRNARRMGETWNPLNAGSDYRKRVVSPNGRWVAQFDDGQLFVTNRRTGMPRVLLQKPVFSFAWSPDSRAIAYIEGRLAFDSARTGEIGVVTLAGRDRIAVRRRGQISALAWTKLPPRVKYRAPETPNGVFAGGPIARLAADGGRVAAAACLDVFAWTPTTDVVIDIGSEHIPGPPGAPNRWGCVAPNQRDEIYDLAVAGDRVAWGEKTSGLIFHWWLFQARLGPPLERYELATGSNAVGSNWYGAGALAASAGSLFYSAWNTTREASERAVTSMTLYRATTSGCPCPSIAYGAEVQAPNGRGATPIVALDTDGDRVAALRYDKLVLLDTSGGERSSFDVRPAAAQLSGDTVVVLVPNELRAYSAGGVLERRWPLPSGSVGRDCRFFSEPQCPWQAELTLQDAARGLALYVYRDEVHVLRLADGRDTVVGYGSEGRFMEDGLVYADGARVRLVPWPVLN